MSEHESGSSDDEGRINEITKIKKQKGNIKYQRVARPTTYDDDDDDDDEDDFNRQLRLEKTKKLQNAAEKVKTKVDPDGTVYEWDPTVKGWFPKVSEEFLVEHHMNYGLESSSGIRYDVHHQTYIQERDGMTYKLDKDTQQWIPLQTYTDDTNKIKYTFSIKHNTWIPDVSTYSTNDQDGKQQTYVWLKDQLKWELLSTVDSYTDHVTGMKYKWNDQTNSWDNEGIEHIEKEDEQLSKQQKPVVPLEVQNEKKKPTEGWYDIPDEKNCNVYVTGLPYDITDAEFEELLSKYGIISPDPNDSRKKKIRLYRDEEGNPKGDGRCRYLRPESVKLCIDMLDESELRSSKLHVERATFQVKGTFNPELKRKRKKMDKKTKQQQVDKLLNWDEHPEVVRHKYERIIVIKNAFDLQQFKNDPLFIDKLRNNIQDSCSEYGEIKKINIYDSNPAGAVTVGFGDIDQADACCQYMNGRIWYGRVIQCQTWDGSTKYDVAASTEEENERIGEWHRFLNEDDNEEQA